MLAIRLRRAGSKKRPFFRVVVADSRAARDSSFVEILGHYNPRTKPALVHVDQARVDYWLSKGAQPSDSVRTLIARHLTVKPAAATRRRRADSEMSAARDVVEVLARALADQPDDVHVTEVEPQVGRRSSSCSWRRATSARRSAARGGRPRRCGRSRPRRARRTARRSTLEIGTRRTEGDMASASGYWLS